MKFFRFLPWVLLASVPAPAQVTLGTSNQNLTYAGIGANVQGDGEGVFTWGNCSYDGKNTTCTVTGPYTGLGNGGTYSFVLTYSGNGPSPLAGISDSPGNNEVTFTLSQGSLLSTLTDVNGTVINFYDFNSYFNFVNPTCTPAGISCAVGQVGLTSGATITGPVNGTMTTVPVIRSTQGVISASAYGAFPAIAPGSWIEIYGINLATTPVANWTSGEFTNNVAPTAVGGTTVTVGGLPAFIDYVSPGQVNAQVPSGVAPGTQPVVVTTAGGSSTAYMITVNPTEPGLLAPSSFVLNNQQYAVALFAGTLTYAFPGTLPGITAKRANVGDNLTLYGVGFGPVTPNIPAGEIASQTSALSSLQVYIGGVPASVTYAGLAPGYVGLYQINIVVPSVPASDTLPLTFSLNGAPGSQTLLISVQN